MVLAKHLIPFSTIHSISISVKRSHFTLFFFKTACYANSEAERNFEGSQSVYFKKHIFKVLKYIR